MSTFPRITSDARIKSPRDIFRMHMTDKLDCVVVGAGVVGLAIARSLALAGREVVVIEAEAKIGMHTSSRNSEVIHTGIYYPENSLKARLCVRGRQLLYGYCLKRRIAHSRIGKLVVAVEDRDLEKLRAIHTQSRKNGITDLSFLDAAKVKSLEPNVQCVGALLSPSTGIIDSHEYISALQADLETHNGTVLFVSEASGVRIGSDGIELSVNGDAVICGTLINAAGLGATNLASGGNRVLDDVPTMYLAKGHYFSYQGRSPFGHLIYPVPSGGGLGIHATIDLSGTAQFGPDVTWIDNIDYSFDEDRKSQFVSAIRRYFPAIDANKLVPAYTGIRPKVVGPGEPAGDFVIHAEADHGVSNLINLYGIESPGLTASLAIADHVQLLLSGCGQM